MIEDAELLRQYASDGSQAAFAALVDRYLNLVYSAALRKSGGDSQRAQDVSQRVFTRLAQRASSLTGYPVLSGWLYTVSTNLAGTMSRDDFRRRKREGAAAEAQALMDTPEPATDWERLGPVLDGAMHQLGRGDREAVLLRFFEGKTYSEIGRRLQLSENGARMRVDRSLDKLNALLNRRGISSTAAALGTALAAQAVTAAPPALAATVTGIGALGAGTPLLTQILLSMSTTKIALAVIAIAAIGSTLYQVKQAHHAETAVAAISLDRDGIAKRLAAEEEQVKQLQGALAASKSSLAEQQAATNRGAAGRNMSGPINFGAMVAELTHNPEYRKLQANTLQGPIDARYAALFKQLALPPDQLAQFKAALAEEQMEVSDAVNLAREQGIMPGTDREGFRQLVQDAQSSSESQIKALLGDAAYGQYQQFEQTIPERTVVNQLQQSLSYTSTPLADDQANRLIPILQHGTESSGGGAGGGISIQSVNGLSTIGTPRINLTDQTIGLAQSVLSPAQTQALQQIQSQQQAQNQMQQLMREYAQKSASNGPAP